ncbi:MAG: hypothetical protein SGILL_004134 [Bacillariaceae sp.]
MMNNSNASSKSSASSAAACALSRTTGTASSASACQSSSSNNRRFAMATLVLGAAAMTVKPAEAFVCPRTTTVSASVKTTSSSLKYSPMPDVSGMKAGDMKHELESYGIPTNTMFDKRDFEDALLSARRDYEQTLKDCMSSTPFSGSPKKSKPKKYNSDGYEESENDFTSVDTSTDSFTNANSSYQDKKKTIPYDRSNPSHFHERERMWDIGSDYTHGNHKKVNVDPFDPTQARSHYHPRDPYYQQGGGNGSGSSSSSSFHGRGAGVETDPLFAHEEQYAYAGGNPHRGPGHYQEAPPRQHVHRHGPPPPHGNRRQHSPEYSDPAVQMKYQAALEGSYKMTVSDLQKELNERGISTKYCFSMQDFCVEYAKAMAEEKNSDSIQEDDYDPSYRDVVMEPYDASNAFF